MIAKDGRSIDVLNQSKLKQVTAQMACHILEFFSEMDSAGENILRPLTNSNFILDFYRFRTAPYHSVMTSYLQHLQQRVPDYERQYHEVTRYYWNTKLLHKYGKISLCGVMTSTPNTKSLQLVTGTEGALLKLARSDYYKYRAANFMFGWNSAILHSLESFCDFNSLRKNQLLRYYDYIKPHLLALVNTFPSFKKGNKYREYYFVAQYEVGQQELVDLHHYTYLVDFCALSGKESEWTKKVQAINDLLADHIHCSTQKRHNYEKIITTDGLRNTKKSYRIFLENFMSTEFFGDYIGLGFSEVNPVEKEITCLTQTVFYTTDLMRQQAHRQEFEFEKECINQMARSSVRRYLTKFNERTDLNQATRINIKIGSGYTYSKYNTLMHFLNVVECYWLNPDLSNVQVFGKDIRALLATSCQKIFFHKGHPGYYYYGPLEDSGNSCRSILDLAVGSSSGTMVPTVSRSTRSGCNEMIITDRVFEYHYLKSILEDIFKKANGKRFKTDNEVLNLCLLSLMLDFGLYEQHVGLLNLPFLHDLQHQGDARELQVELANQIYDFDRKNMSDSVTRSRVQELIFEVSHKFLINKDFSVQSKQFKLIQELNADPVYQSYVLTVKAYVSLCQINKSVEVDYYKVRLDEEFRIVIPNNFSKTTSDYLEEVTTRYTFSEKDGIMLYDDIPVFDLRPHQPEIDLYKIRFDASTAVQSMVKYVEISNVLRVSEDESEKYLIFVADNVLAVCVSEMGTTIKINNIAIEVATIFFNEAISFVPCMKYNDSDDAVLFASQNVHYLVDQGGQFNTDYYGMRHELIEFIKSEEIFVDTNDEHTFKSYKLTELLTESKTVFYYPDYLLQVPNRSHLINLLDLSLRIRNVSFFILILFYLRRCSISLEFIEKENDVTRISGPWREAILYVLNKTSPNLHYDAIFSKLFFDLNRHDALPLEGFIDVVCENFTRYQRFVDSQYQIIPTEKQKSFLKKIICGEECFHFSEVGTGKTKVILPLLCQIFLSTNEEAHIHFSRGGKPKHVLVVLVPEHLVSDARTQVFRYCLNLNFRDEYRIYDDIFALMHRSVQVSEANGSRPAKSIKKIFVTSFNQFKKALTFDNICAKVRPHRENFLVIADEVDDFLDRNKLVFNICSNKSNTFDMNTIDLFYEVSRSAYCDLPFRWDALDLSRNPEYWMHLHRKFRAIHSEIQDASQSINKNFGIFNEYTLRHCSSNTLHDIEGYKSQIARPYESVNRAMPGSYFSDVERTIYLTYVILTEDVAKYDDLFQSERKYINFDYWNEHLIGYLDFDDLVYGHEKLSEIVNKHPELTDGLIRYLYKIILRRMEIRDKSRSVSSIDVIFNFDCIGFTGTPFLDNYPTFAYLRQRRLDQIPNIIDRTFYAFTSEDLPDEEFRKRFARFQGTNATVSAEYISSDSFRNTSNEMDILESIFEREANDMILNPDVPKFNVIVDLCGIFKRSTIHDVRNLLVKHFGQEHFQYIYHIDQVDNSDRILSISSENDVQYNEEFYRNGCKVHGKSLREVTFFFVDNRNVIGKDIPFQLDYHKHFGQPLFSKSIVLAHDIDDFSKIWQAMGRSRTMNHTVFNIYKSDIHRDDCTFKGGPHDIKLPLLTRRLYINNCDSKMAGNISSIYLTLIALLNLAQNSFYFRDEIVNVFLEKMEQTIDKNIAKHETELIRCVLGNPVTARILGHTIRDKFRRSFDSGLAAYEMSHGEIEELLRHIVHQKFEQRILSNDIFDRMITFLSGDQKSQMEISYTKQQQKQKQKQQNKNQDSDAMGIFESKNQMPLSHRVASYFENTLKPCEDLGKVLLNLPVSFPILQLHYNIGVDSHQIQVYPTVQFLYSHFVYGEYVTKEVQTLLRDFKDESTFYRNFVEVTGLVFDSDSTPENHVMSFPDDASALSVHVEMNFIRQNPQYCIAALSPGIYLMGMKDQLNRYDMKSSFLQNHIQYISDETGFILFDRTESKQVERFGPYFVEQYILMETLSKNEIAQNVMEYFSNNRGLLQRGLDSYDEQEGIGFVCWRFLINEVTKSERNHDQRDDERQESM